MTKRLLAITDPGCPASTRIRVKQFESYLQSRGVTIQIFDWQAKGPGRPAAFAALLEYVAKADAVVFQRYLPRPATLRRIRRHARRLVYDFDDAVIYSESTHGNPRLKLRRMWRFRRMMRWCDAVSGGNEYLASIARRYGASNVHVLPTTIDLSEFESLADGSDVGVPNSNTGPVVGWIGLPSTLPYLEGLRRPLERLAEEVPALKIRVISGQRPNLGRVPVEFVQWTPQAEAQEIGRLRVGLAPLLDDPWTRGKCARRLTQYMAAGVPSVASPVGAQAEVIDYGAALPANTEDEWVRAVRTILEDSSVAVELAGRGRQMVRKRFAAQVWAEPLHNIWCGDV